MSFLSVKKVTNNVLNKELNDHFHLYQAKNIIQILGAYALIHGVNNICFPLDIFQEYCNLWNLSGNSSKTKVIVFSKRKGRQNYIVKLNGAELEIVDSLSYLGIVFKYSGNIFDARKKLVEVTKVIVRYLQENTKPKYKTFCMSQLNCLVNYLTL